MSERFHSVAEHTHGDLTASGFNRVNMMNAGMASRIVGQQYGGDGRLC
jgi:hypothetical protein